MDYKDYYKTLGVARDSKEDEIKRAYRKLARKYHPDVSKEPNAEEKFKEVQEAYEVLKDPQKRAKYDTLGSNWQSGDEFRPPPNWQGGFDFKNAGFEENLGGFSDFFSSIFGGGGGGKSNRRGHQFHQRGQDERAKIQISLEEAYRGGEKTIQLQMPEVDANGQMRLKTKALKVNIPPGITNGQLLRLANQGSPGIGQGTAGDLYLMIEIAPHPYFTLQNKDIYLTLPITPWEAALGAKVPVPTLGGKVELTIAPGSQSGQKLRLKGRGLPGKPNAGDQYALLQILTPTANTDAKRVLYEKMAQEMPFNPRAKIL